MMKKNKLSREELCDILANSDGYLKRILAVIGASPDEQEEIAHQAIFNAYEKLHSLREPEKLLSWLTTVAKRLYNSVQGTKCLFTKVIVNTEQTLLKT